MKVLWLNHFQNARDSLRANRTRTGLTIIGVTIGIASIVAILSLGVGASDIVQRQVDELGGNIAVIRPKAIENVRLETLLNQQARGAFATSTLTESDLVRLDRLKSVAEIAPLMILPGTLEGDSVAPTTSTVVATTPGFTNITAVKTAEGQLQTDESAPTTAVIGVQLAIDLFGTEHALGKTFTINGSEFRVIGILERQSNPVNYNSVDLDRTALISMDAGRILNKDLVQIQQINVQSDSVANLDQMIIDINKTLLETHDGSLDFAVLSGDEVAQPSGQFFFTIAGMVAAIAGISLLVGGIGIMNIMLVSVAERTREIGIRKAIGATNGDIVWQFLIESLVMAFIGGLVGIVVGFMLAFVVSLLLPFDPAITWQIIVAACAIALIVGLLFGLYPAYRAARKQPIEALQHYS